MPRIKALAKNYIDKDLMRNIQCQMYMAGVTQKMIGIETRQTQQAVSQKLKNGTLSAKELMIIFKMCNTSDEDILKIMKF